MRTIRSDNSVTRNIVQDLGLAIVTGKYDRTGFPTEKELYEHYKASRNVTREAVKMLTAKGLLTARPRVGTTIQPEDHWNLLDPDVLKWILARKFSLPLLIEFMQMRLAIEPEAAALAARYGTPAQKKAIQDTIARMQAAERGEDDTLESDIAFHVSVLYATNNRFYRQMHEMIETALRFSISRTNKLMGLENSETHEHKAIADAISEGNVSEATRLMRKMIEGLLNLLTNARNDDVK